MQLRQNKGARPQITFTSDFHELVQGDLIPGPCVLRYDPLRLVTLGDAATEGHRIRAYVRFHPLGSEWQGVMELPAGLPLAEMADPTGEGIMLTSTFELPQGCNELEVWFSCTHDDGQTHWDSDFGKNHWLRFGLADLAIKVAKVKGARKKAVAQDSLDLEFTTPAAVQALEVRWIVTTAPGTPRQTASLVASATTATTKTWTPPTGGIPVPRGATIAYDVVYHVDGHKFTDDNQGNWYIAD